MLEVFTANKFATKNKRLALRFLKDSLEQNISLFVTKFISFDKLLQSLLAVFINESKSKDPFKRKIFEFREGSLN